MESEAQGSNSHCPRRVASTPLWDRTGPITGFSLLLKAMSLAGLPVLVPPALGAAH